MIADPTEDTQGKAAGARSAILYLVGSLVQGLGLLLIQPFAIRMLDSEQWGLVSTSVVTIQVVVVLISAGLPLAITRLWFVADNGQQRSRGMYGFLSLSALLLGALLAVIVVFASQQAEVPVTWPTVLAMVAIGLLGSVLGAQAVLRAQNRPLAFVVLSMVSSVAANLAGLGAIILISPSATAYLAAYCCAVAAASAVAFAMVAPKTPWRVRGVVRESLAIALPLLPHTGALMLLTQGAVLLLAFVSGPVPAGQFGAVLIFALGPLTLLNALNNAWSTRLMGAPVDKLPAVLRVVATEAVLASAAIGLLASAAASLGSIILTTSPEQLAPVARILPLVSVGYGLFLIATNVVYILGKTRSMAYATPIILVATAAMAVPFAAGGDLQAIAIAQAAGFLLLGLAYWIVVRSPMPEAWPIRLSISLVAIHILSVVALSFIPVTQIAGFLEIGAVGVLVVGALYRRVMISRAIVGS